MNNHRGWDLCPTGEPLTRFRRRVSVTYTIYTYETAKTPSLREGILHAYVRCGVIFTQACAGSGIIAIAHHDNVSGIAI